MCVTHPLASSAVVAAAWGTGHSAEAKDALKRDKYGRTDTGECRFVPVSHDAYGQAGPPAFVLLHELAELCGLYWSRLVHLTRLVQLWCYV